MIDAATGGSILMLIVAIIAGYLGFRSGKKEADKRSKEKRKIIDMKDIKFLVIALVIILLFTVIGIKVVS